MKTKSPEAVILGRKGGKARSEAKVASSRINAAKATAARVTKLKKYKDDLRIAMRAIELMVEDRNHDISLTKKEMLGHVEYALEVAAEDLSADLKREEQV